MNRPRRDQSSRKSVEVPTLMQVHPERLFEAFEFVQHAPGRNLMHLIQACLAHCKLPSTTEPALELITESMTKWLDWVRASHVVLIVSGRPQKERLMIPLRNCCRYNQVPYLYVSQDMIECLKQSGDLELPPGSLKGMAFVKREGRPFSPGALLDLARRNAVLDFPYHANPTLLQEVFSDLHDEFECAPNNNSHDWLNNMDPITVSVLLKRTNLVLLAVDSLLDNNRLVEKLAEHCLAQYTRVVWLQDQAAVGMVCGHGRPTLAAAWTPLTHEKLSPVLRVVYYKVDTADGSQQAPRDLSLERAVHPKVDSEPSMPLGASLNISPLSTKQGAEVPLTNESEYLAVDSTANDTALEDKEIYTGAEQCENSHSKGSRVESLDCEGSLGVESFGCDKRQDKVGSGTAERAGQTLLEREPERLHPSVHGVGAIGPYGQLGNSILSFLTHCRESAKTTTVLKYLRMRGEEKLPKMRWIPKTNLFIFRWGVRDCKGKRAMTLRQLCRDNQIPHLYVNRTFFEVFNKTDPRKQHMLLDAVALVNLTANEKYSSTIAMMMQIAWKTVLLEFPYYENPFTLKSVFSSVVESTWTPVRIDGLERGTAWMTPWSPQVPDTRDALVKATSELAEDKVKDVLATAKVLLLAVTALVDPSIWRLGKLCRYHSVRVMFFPDEAFVSFVAGTALTAAAAWSTSEANSVQVRAALRRATLQSALASDEKSGAVFDAGQMTTNGNAVVSYHDDSVTAAPTFAGKTRQRDETMDDGPLKKQRTTDPPPFTTLPILPTYSEFGQSPVHMVDTSDVSHQKQPPCQSRPERAVCPNVDREVMESSMSSGGASMNGSSLPTKEGAEVPLASDWNQPKPRVERLDCDKGQEEIKERGSGVSFDTVDATVNVMDGKGKVIYSNAESCENQQSKGSSLREESMDCDKSKEGEQIKELGSYVSLLSVDARVNDMASGDDKEDEIYSDAKPARGSQSKTSPRVERLDSDKSQERIKEQVGGVSFLAVDTAVNHLASDDDKEKVICSAAEPCDNSQSKGSPGVEGLHCKKRQDRPQPQVSSGSDGRAVQTLLERHPEKLHSSLQGPGAVAPNGQLGKRILSYLIHCRDSTKTTACVKYIRVRGDTELPELSWISMTNLILLRWGLRGDRSNRAKSLRQLCRKHEIPHMYVTRTFFEVFNQKDTARQYLNIDGVALVNLTENEKYSSTVAMMMQIAWKTVLLDSPYFESPMTLESVISSAIQTAWTPVDKDIFALDRATAWMTPWIPELADTGDSVLKATSHLAEDIIKDILTTTKVLLLAVTALDQSIWRLAKLCQRYFVRVIFLPDEAAVGSIAGTAPTAAATWSTSSTNYLPVKAALQRATFQIASASDEKSGTVSDARRITSHNGETGDGFNDDSATYTFAGEMRQREPRMDDRPSKKQRTTDLAPSKLPFLSPDDELGQSSVAVKAALEMDCYNRSNKGGGCEEDEIDTVLPNQKMQSSIRRYESTADHFSWKRLTQLWTAQSKSDWSFSIFAPYMRSTFDVGRHLSVSSLEVLATDKQDPSGRHRRERMWRTILDVRIMRSKTDVAARTTSWDDFDEKPSEGEFVDEGIPLCPDELVGECCNPSCQYQHLEEHFKGLAQVELLPLPPIDLHSCVSSSAFNVIDDLVGQWFSKTVHFRKRRTTASGDGPQPIVGFIESMSGCTIQCSVEYKTTVAFILDSLSIEKGEWLNTICNVVDAIRLAMHAGRFDISSALCACANSLCDDLISTGSHRNRRCVEQCGRIMKIVEQRESEAFCLSQNAMQNPFLLALESQVFLVATMAYLKKLCFSSNESHCSSFVDKTRSDDLELLASLSAETDESLRVTADSIFSGKNLAEFLGSELTSDETEAGLSLPMLFRTVRRARAIKKCLVEEERTTTASLEHAVRFLSEQCRTVVELALAPLVSSTNMHDSLLRIVIVSSFTLLGVLECISNRLGSEESVRRATEKVTRLYSGIDEFLCWLLGFATSVPLVDLMLAPVIAANLALGSTLQLYSRVQGRLESLLRTNCTEVVGSEMASSFLSYSEMLWSELLQLRSLLPNISREALDGAEHSRDFKHGHKVVGSAVLERGVWPRHCVLDNDRNLLLDTSSARALQQMFIIYLTTSVGQQSDRILTNDTKFVHSSAPHGHMGYERSALPLRLLRSSKKGGKEWNASSAGLRKLPACFGNCLTWIVDLNLDDNELQDLPLSFSMLRCLVSLRLCNNKLSSLPECFSFPELKTFCASNNAINHMPDSFWECKRLEVLDLSRNSLDRSFRGLCERFGNLRSLVY